MEPQCSARNCAYSRRGNGEPGRPSLSRQEVETIEVIRVSVLGHRVLRRPSGGAFAGVKCLEEADMISNVKDKWELSNEWREEELCSRQR